jgi:ubiquinone/menaquinone biosynthesis C-methylase UbiE
VADLLSRYDAEFPGFVDYFQRLLSGYFGVGPRTHPAVALRMEECLRAMGPEVSRKALDELAQAGIFRDELLSDDVQVKAFWTSPLMSLYRAAISYAPSSQDDLVGSFPSPAASLDEHAARQAAYRGTRLTSVEGGAEKRYWSEVLQVAAPELYLWPFLGGRGELHGLDLGCGWGRGALGMRDFSNLRMTGVDIGDEELEMLRVQAAKAGLSDRVEARWADITSLPFAAGTFDFALTYAVLDLLSEQALQSALHEVLRCLKADSPFYVDLPNEQFCGAMMLQKHSRRGFADLLHGMEAHGKVFQLAFHDLRVPRQYTFAVLSRDALEFPKGGRRPSWLVAETACRLRRQPPPNRRNWREVLRTRTSRPAQAGGAGSSGEKPPGTAEGPRGWRH